MGEGADGVGADPFGESARLAALVFELGREVAQKRRGPAVCVGVVADPGGAVDGVGGAVESGELGAGESAGEQLDEFGEEDDALGEGAVVAAGRQVERVERDGVWPRKGQVGAVDGVAEAAVFVFGVDDEDLHALVEQPQCFEFGEVALAGAGAGEDDAVVVVAGEAVEDDRRAGVGQPVEAALIGEWWFGGGEGEGGRERLAVEGAAQAQPIEAERQRREPALERPKGGRGAAQELRGAEGLDAFGCAFELVLCVGADREVEAGAVEAALPARESGREVFGVVGGGGDAEVAEAAAFELEAAGRLEAGALFLQPLCCDLGRERFDVERDVELRRGAQEWCEPAVADLTRVAADRECPLPACSGADAVGAQLERGGAEQARLRQLRRCPGFLVAWRRAEGFAHG